MHQFLPSECLWAWTTFEEVYDWAGVFKTIGRMRQRTAHQSIDLDVDRAQGVVSPPYQVEIGENLGWQIVSAGERWSGAPIQSTHCQESENHFTSSTTVVHGGAKKFQDLDVP